VPASAWCARLAETALKNIALGHTGLSDVANRVPQADGEMAGRPHLTAVLKWLEKRVAAAATRIVPNPAMRCAAHKRWLMFEFAYKTEPRNGWKVVHEVPGSRLADLAKDHESEALKGVISALHDDSLTPENAERMDARDLWQLGRDFGVGPGLLELLNEDTAGCT